ncbi:YggS family pyridoxal phosphate-dependent enzyme [Phenylobacterium deserti]|uniref:Pyridoxal phosphate homeostasis protein n=1 Tax=Phenylobacterium deserti TaxID=1914756 RepID=A0A328AE12_9CAUL|nr:YggS family pyridoxal phosphate-dependent enzyme [Phenylobacterium deserti]RAK52727.1 YggS family pyridoxal phosphate-dependent enzyme [Phenylobacterium deserti]
MEPSSLADALARVRARMALACARVGRDPAEVRLLPISKTQDLQRLREAVAADLDEFGENKPQELAAKAEQLSELGLRWVAVGRLQTNKAGLVAAHAHEFQALDSLRAAEALQRRLERLGRRLRVYLQVNTSAEPSKSGVAPGEAADLARSLRGFDALEPVGLMTLAIWSDDEAQVRACFRRLRDCQARLREAAPDAGRWDELSMGMSGDFELAIEEGATVVRVGQAIFGARALPHAHYWPAG